MKYLILIVFSLLLTSCYVDKSDLKNANDMCKDNGGINSVNAGNTIFVSTVFCENGLSIKLTLSRIEKFKESKKRY